jgi:transketolase
VYAAGDAAVGGRKYSEVILNALAPSLPELFGGSADLTSSNYTRVKNAEDFQAPSTGRGSYRGKYIRYGVREHAMGAIMNGISAYGLFIPFAGTFLNFVRDALRWLSCILCLAEQSSGIIRRRSDSTVRTLRTSGHLGGYA